MATAVVTGGSRGLGRALARGLVQAGWSVVIDARDAEALATARDELVRLAPDARVVAVPGDVTDPAHRHRLVAEAAALGGLDLLVNNAGTLGPSPQPHLADYPLDEAAELYGINVIGPLGLIQEALPLLRRADRPAIVNVTSDASVEAYDGWGGYGSAKAALDHLSAVLAVEEPAVTVWSVDPGDLRTEMHQRAFPGEDISDRPEPESVVAAFLTLVGSDRPGGRVRLAEVAR
jgi:NAD(P)-dependent dehydrogenase (short-subunit alcohol dehydrogenase family)